MAGTEGLFSDEDILSFRTQTFEVTATLSDLRQLRPKFVQMVYCNFLQDLNISLDRTNQLPYDVSDSVRQHPQCFQSIGKIMVLSRILNNFLKRINKESDFMPGDFYDPKILRTKRFFSMQIEFHDFVCQNSARLLDIESDMLKQIAEMKDEILETQGCKNDLKRQYDDTKVAISACESAIQVAELKTVEKKEVAEQIASQIIQPIEREELKERENFLARIRKENSGKKILAKLKQTLDVCRCASELMENELMPCLSEIQQIKNNIKELKTGISQHETSRRTLMEKSEDHKMKIQQLQEVFLSKQAKNSQMRVTWNRKIEGLKEENKSLNMSLENIMQSKAEDEIVAQDIVNERKKILQETQLYKKQIAHFDKSVLENYKILCAIEMHNEDIQKSFESLTSSLLKEPGKV